MVFDSVGRVILEVMNPKMRTFSVFVLDLLYFCIHLYFFGRSATWRVILVGEQLVMNLGWEFICRTRSDVGLQKLLLPDLRPPPAVGQLIIHLTALSMEILFNFWWKYFWSFHGNHYSTSRLFRSIYFHPNLSLHRQVSHCKSIPGFCEVFPDNLEPPAWILSQKASCFMGWWVTMTKPSFGMNLACARTQGTAHLYQKHNALWIPPPTLCNTTHSVHRVLYSY